MKKAEDEIRERLLAMEEKQGGEDVNKLPGIDQFHLRMILEWLSGENPGKEGWRPNPCRKYRREKQRLEYVIARGKRNPALDRYCKFS